MKHTECKDCELSKGDCGNHFKMDGVTNYDIASLSACDKYGNCMFFKLKANPQGDLISREALIFELRQQLAFKKEKAKLTTINADKMAHSLVATGLQLAIDIIDNAPTVSDRYDEGYAQGTCDCEHAHERPQGELANEVWKLYKKHQSHLATHVIEFGDELKELLDKYQKGGAE